MDYRVINEFPINELGFEEFAQIQRDRRVSHTINEEYRPEKVTKLVLLEIGSEWVTYHGTVGKFNKWVKKKEIY